MVIVALSTGGQNQADRFAGVELTTVPVAGQVHMVQLPGGGGNVGGFARPDGADHGGSQTTAQVLQCASASQFFLDNRRPLVD